jgi:hypothetical protein
MRARLVRTVALLIAAALISPVAIGQDADETAKPESSYKPLRPMSQCLIPERVRDWAYINDQEILVNAGRKKYRIRMSYGCPALAFGVFIRFDPGPGIGRMCGNLNEAVIADGTRCHVAAVERIDQDEWDETLKQPGVSLNRHAQGRTPTPYLADRQSSDMDVSRSR